MLTEREIQEHKALIEKYNSEVQWKAEKINEGKIRQQQALEILKEYGLSSLSDRSKLQEEIDQVLLAIQNERKDMTEELARISQLRDALDEVISGS